jgi:hypothetical protein
LFLDPTGRPRFLVDGGFGGEGFGGTALLACGSWAGGVLAFVWASISFCCAALSRYAVFDRDSDGSLFWPIVTRTGLSEPTGVAKVSA